jgi:zinc and cadmium transporter
VVIALASTARQSGQAQQSGQALGAVAWLLPISAASFLYIAMVDLLPELQSERRPGFVLAQIAALAFGVALALGLTLLPGA